jgi:hypothetical protein
MEQLVSGLMLMGFAGHSVLPTIRNDMADTQKYDRHPL